jgi:hypothetical protein
MNDEDSFHCQLGRTIQSWLGVETELYGLYALLMRGANTHLVSATFYSIQSVDAKLRLLNSCLALVLSRQEPEWKIWRGLLKKAEQLNKKRNKIVHEPVAVSVSGGLRTVAISPSVFNALAIVKRQTTHKGAVITASYKPSNAQFLRDHTIELSDLYAVEQAFDDFYGELREFYNRIEPRVLSAPSAAKKKRGTASAT